MEQHTRRETVRDIFMAVGGALGVAVFIASAVQSSYVGPAALVFGFGIMLVIGGGVGWVVGSLVAALFPEGKGG